MSNALKHNRKQKKKKLKQNVMVTKNFRDCFMSSFVFLFYHFCSWFFCHITFIDGFSLYFQSLAFIFSLLLFCSPSCFQYEYYTFFTLSQSALFFFLLPTSPPLIYLSHSHTALPLCLLPVLFQTWAHHTSPSLHCSLSFFVSRVDDISAGECYCGNQSSAPQGYH